MRIDDCMDAGAASTMPPESSIEEGGVSTESQSSARGAEDEPLAKRKRPALEGRRSAEDSFFVDRVVESIILETRSDWKKGMGITTDMEKRKAYIRKEPCYQAFVDDVAEATRKFQAEMFRFDLKWHNQGSLNPVTANTKASICHYRKETEVYEIETKVVYVGWQTTTTSGFHKAFTTRNSSELEEGVRVYYGSAPDRFGMKPHIDILCISNSPEQEHSRLLIYEVKTSTDDQSVKTAIGELLWAYTVLQFSGGVGGRQCDLYLLVPSPLACDIDTLPLTVKINVIVVEELRDVICNCKSATSRS